MSPQWRQAQPASKFLDGLVKAVAKDGSIWWTFPENVASVKARESEIVPTIETYRAGVNSYNRFYDQKVAKIWEAHDKLVAERAKTSQPTPGALGNSISVDHS